MWRVYVAYSDDWDPSWFTNRSGQTYGLPNASIAPDLLAVWTADGKLGYTPSEPMLGFAAEPSFHSDAEVRAYLAEKVHPPQRFPVFTEDGETQIGWLSVPSLPLDARSSAG